ncbi:type II secretion system protein GspC [Polyangium aurulentum]|uniref:type II secretion system protein GspC n=1 Tax=Polyangium aurulentum TaxID=2567896 RepID=UPI0010AEEAB4|nr:type II secretion system protein GspC [Polyangium aurulentum]UQA57240.1 PDZ domain-containing protein [Polyangium aurulentum]
MGLDAHLKRWFPAVLALLVAVAAYFQASGMGQIVASSVLLDPSSMPPPPAPPPAAAGHASFGNERSTNGMPILSRNPFDSVTGPLDGSNAPPPSADALPPVSTDPYEDPVCDGGKVLLITESDDEDWSFVSLAGADGKSVMRRRGDEFGGRTVHAIAWDRVWLMQGGTRCQMKLHDDGGPKVASGAGVSGPKTDGSDTPAPPRRGGAATLPPEIAEKIRKTGENTFDVDRSAISAIMERQGDLMRSVRIAPQKQDGKTVGLRVSGVRPGSLLGTLGVQNGDQLQGINGMDISDPQKALEAYARLQMADKISVQVVRGGKPMTIDVNIK